MDSIFKDQFWASLLNFKEAPFYTEVGCVNGENIW